jgi:ABC-type phosphate transport system substrate-binding protein
MTRKATVLREFANWSLSDRGQDYGAQLGYLPLSAASSVSAARPW